MVQLGYWLLYALLLGVLYFLLTLFQRPPMPFMHWCRLMGGFAVIPGIIGFYSFYAWVFPHYLRTKSRIELILLSLAAATLATLAGIMLLTVLFNANYWDNDGLSGVLGLAIPIMFIALVNGAIGFIVKGFESWLMELKLREEVNLKNYEMELALVKSQMDPHFLFNTINNIDILIEKDSVKASAYLNKLSDIMRFMLYETKANRILLTNELAYIEKYIALQKIRTSNVHAISYGLQGDPDGRMIAPMLFIPFIENAFKHTNLRADHAVRISFTIREDLIVFECENQAGPGAGPEKQPGGLGNKLMERRLELLYPGKHHLETVLKDEEYRVKLTVEE